MPRDAAILYQKPKGGRLEFAGVVRLSGGSYYWVILWLSSLEPLTGGIRFVPWDRPHPKSGQVPTPNLKPVFAKIVLAENGAHLESRTERACVQIWPRLTACREVFEVILSPAKTEGGNR
jgi:hypothetical protein